jgi:hypothetical protein
MFQADRLLNLIAQCWRDTAAVSGPALTNSIQITGTASELLRVAMSIESVTHRAIIRVIDCIHSGHVRGRSAIYCISEVRITLLSRDSSEKLSDLEVLMEAIENTKLVAQRIIRPFFAASGNQLHLQEACICLDLLPDSLNLLRFLRKKVKRSTKYETDLLDDLMSNEWHPAGFLPICCALCEIFPHLKSRHLEEFKV